MVTKARPLVENVPAALADCPQWVCWRTEERGGKPTKVPYCAFDGARASSTDPDTWSSLPAALGTSLDRGFDGVGFVFATGGGLVGIDLDGCRDPETEEIAPWAADIVSALDSYTEISPSGRGLHIFVRGTLPEGPRRKGPVEMYDRGRYFTVTGDHLDRTPGSINERTEELAYVHASVLAPAEPPIPSTNGHTPPAPVDLDDQQILQRMFAASNGADIDALWNGRLGSYDSASEADLALCNHLAFWTGKDAARMDQLFRQSGLMRAKWTERHYGDGRAYGEETINKAIANCTETYSGPSQPVTVGTPTGTAGATTALWTAASLLAADLPEPEFVVRDILPVGLTLLAGRPKRGKSWLALQIGIDTTNGSASLGFETRKGTVIYCALEDSPRRLQRRLSQMAAPASENLIFLTEMPAIDSDKLAHMRGLCSRRPALLIIDTLARAISGKRDQDSVGEMTEILSTLQHLAHEFNMAILVIDHHRKMGMETADLIDDVLGSTAKTAVADAILGLYRKSGESAARLAITGRDIEERELAMEWDALRFRWKVGGDLQEKVMQKRRNDIIDFLRRAERADVRAVAEHLGCTRPTARELLREMAHDKQILSEWVPSPGQAGKKEVFKVRGWIGQDE